MNKWKENERHSLSPHLSGLKILFGSKYWIWNYQVEKLSFVTPYHISDQIGRYADLLYRKLDDSKDGRSSLVWDMFGGIGSDSMSLSRYFSVLTTELDEKTYKCLLKNVKSFRLTNVNVILGNCMSLLKVVIPDVIYFDPPWGEGYKSKLKEFSFSEVFLDYPALDVPDLSVQVKCTDLAQYLYDHVCQQMIIKSPMNSDSFDDLFKDKIYYTFYFPKNNLKFLFIV